MASEKKKRKAKAMLCHENCRFTIIGIAKQLLNNNQNVIFTLENKKK